MTLFILIRDLLNGLHLKKMLEANPQVSEVAIVSMGNGKVRFRFVYSGVIEKLQANLGVKGYQMRNEGGYYAIN